MCAAKNRYERRVERKGMAPPRKVAAEGDAAISQKLFGREYDGASLKAVAVDRTIHGEQDSQDDDYEQQDNAHLVDMFAKIVIQVLGGTDEGQKHTP